MSARLCPKCGAYWKCDCTLDDVYDPAKLSPPLDPSCNHDWTDVVSVEIDETFGSNAKVIVCRLCGLYAVALAEGSSN